MRRSLKQRPLNLLQKRPLKRKLQRLLLMALTIVATAGAANANSYITLSNAQDVVDSLVEDDDVVAGLLLLQIKRTVRFIQRRNELIVKDF